MYVVPKVLVILYWDSGVVATEYQKTLGCRKLQSEVHVRPPAELAAEEPGWKPKVENRDLDAQSLIVHGTFAATDTSS